MANFTLWCAIFRGMKSTLKLYSLLALLVCVAMACNPEETGEKMHDVPVLTASYYQEALKAITETVEQNPNNPDGYYQKARILEAMGNQNNAILNLKRAVKLDSSNSLYHKELARLFLLTAKYPRAEESIQIAWQLGDRTASTLSILTQVHAEQGGYAQAMNFLNKALETEPQNSQLIFQKAKLYLMQGDTVRAKQQLEQNLERLQDQPQIFEVLSDLYRKEKNYRQAISYMNKSIALQPDNKELPMRAVELLLESGRPDSAQVVLQEMQRKRGQQPELMLLIGRMQLVQNKTDSAEYYFSRTLALDSRSKEAYFWLGKLFDRKRQYFTAREQYRNALLLDTTYVEAQQALHTVQLTLDRIERWKRQQAELNSLPDVNSVKPQAVE